MPTQRRRVREITSSGKSVEYSAKIGAPVSDARMMLGPMAGSKVGPTLEDMRTTMEATAKGTSKKK